MSRLARHSPMPTTIDNVPRIADDEAEAFSGRIVVVLAARNEGQNVVRTIRAFRSNRAPSTDLFFSVVDDGSDDGSCASLDRAADVSCVRNPSPCSQAAARNLGALRFIDERPDCLVFMDAHEEPASRHCLERVALAAIRFQAVVCPICMNMDRERDFTGAGGRLAWYPVRDIRSRQGPGLRIEWCYKRDCGLEPVAAVYGGCYAMTPETFLALGGFMDTAGVYGYAEQALSLNAWFQGMERYCCTTAAVRHLFRRERPYPMSGVWYWRNYVYCNRIIWSDEAFRGYLLPVAQRWGSDPMLDCLTSAAFVADLRDAFAERKTRSDAQCLEWLGVIEP